VATLRTELGNLENYIFGSTAAIITNVSLIAGLGSAQAGRIAVLGGILTIAVADNISDSLGIHMYKETEGCGERFSFLATVLNFMARLFISLSFIAIVLGFSAAQAWIVAMGWGLILLILLSYLIARRNRENAWLEISKHVAVAICVIAASRYIGYLIAKFF
jgi:hypothetical protein